MKRWLNSWMLAGTILAVGTMFAVLPPDWIEARLGFKPDGGSGLIEFLAAAIPLGIGIALAARVWGVSRRRKRLWLKRGPSMVPSDYTSLPASRGEFRAPV
jgi:hypothetical protein